MEQLFTLNQAAYTREGDTVTLTALPKTDYFVNPETGEITANGQFAYLPVSGDFILLAKVSHAFSHTYDACALFAMENDTTWAKACFEQTDFGTRAVVSVMTNGASDDANGVNVEADSIWLRLSRKGNAFAFHYSMDGTVYTMARICRIPMGAEIKVGLLAQSPLGPGGARVFENVSLTQKALADLRAGV